MGILAPTREGRRHGRFQPEGPARRPRRRRTRPLRPLLEPTVRADPQDPGLRPQVGPRGGSVPVRPRRDPVSRLARRLRHVQRGTQQRGRAPRPRRHAGAADSESATARPLRPARAAGRSAPARGSPIDRPRAVRQQRHRGRRGGPQAGPGRRSQTARGGRRERLSRPDARLDVGERQRLGQGGLRAAAARRRLRALQRSRGARSRAAPRRRGALSDRTRPGSGRRAAAARLPGGSAAALPALRHAVLRRRGADRLWPHRHDVRPRALGARARSRHGSEVTVGRLCAGRRPAAALVGPRGRLRLARARHRARLDLRPRRHGDGRRPCHPRGARGARSGRP